MKRIYFNTEFKNDENLQLLKTYTNDVYSKSKITTQKLEKRYYLNTVDFEERNISVGHLIDLIIELFDPEQIIFQDPY